jgi:hypothetical protein
VARSVITPTLLTADSTFENLTGLVASANGTTAVTPTSGAGNGVLFTNYGPGSSLLLVGLGTTATTLTVVIGTTLFGNSATSFSVGPLTISTLSIVGPFHSALDQGGTSQVAVDFSSATNVICAVLQLAGVY